MTADLACWPGVTTWPPKNKSKPIAKNALSSTGPRTPEGKARSSADRTTHALTGRHTVHPAESQEDSNQLLAALAEEWSPQTESQQVDLIAHHWWRLLRIARLETDTFARKLEIRQKLALTDDLERISRYEVRSCHGSRAAAPVAIRQFEPNSDRSSSTRSTSLPSA